MTDYRLNFLKIRFNNLPQNDIGKFLKNIVEKENIDLSSEKITAIQKLYGSDIRNMINFIQCNHILDHSHINIISDDVWKQLTTSIKHNSSKKTPNYKAVITRIKEISITYNITIKNIIKDYLTYLIKYQKIDVTSEFLDFVEKLLHNTESPESNFAYYALVNLDKFATLL